MWPEALEPLGAIPGLDISTGTIRVTGTSLRDVNLAINRVQSLVGSFTGADTFSEAAKLDTKLDRFRDSVFMAHWQAGPPVKKTPPQ